MKIFQIHVLILSVWCFAGCASFIEIDPPRTSVVSESVFDKDNTAISAVIGIYSAMVNTHNIGYRIPYLAGLSGDELLHYTVANEGVEQTFKNALDANGTTATALWERPYSYIFQANAVIENLAASTGVSTAVKQQLTGEAYFIRAFWFFYLVNFYGDIPLVTTTDYTVNTVEPRASKTAVYEQIIADLQQAGSLLSDDYVALNTVDPSVERVRANRPVASALMARAYLYMGKWEDAAEQATALIGNTSRYQLMDSLNDVFLSNSKEAILQFTTTNTSEYLMEANYFILTGDPAVGNNFNFSFPSLSTWLLDAFEPGDRRLDRWVDTVMVGSKVYYYVYKLKAGGNTSGFTEYSTPMRLAEQYLIRAEAYAQLDRLPDAIADIDMIRKRAGLPLIKDTQPGIGKEALLDVILHERQTELFVEWGHRWMDLKRTGKVDEVMNVITPLKGGSWKSSAQLFPIPRLEIERHPGMQQNEDY